MDVKTAATMTVKTAIAGTADGSLERRGTWPRSSFRLNARSLDDLAVSSHLGFLAKRVIEQAAPRFRLKTLPVKDVTWRRPICVIYRKDAYLSPAARRFIEVLKAVAKESASR